MVKMETTEPSVILKLKKGGHVAGHSAMKSTMSMDAADGKFAPPGKAPKKPSIMDRRKSMKAPMLMSKDGGVAKKAMGGMMMNPAMMRMMAQRGAGRPGMAASMGPAMAASKRPAMAAPMGLGMAASKNPKMASSSVGGMMNPAVARMLTPLGAGRPGMAAPTMKKGGKAGDMGQDKAMIKKAFKQHDAQEHMGGEGTKLKLRKGGTTKVVDGGKTDKAHGTGVVKMGKPGGYATGGSIPSETSSGSYKTTKMHQGKKDSASGTGGVRMSNAGGFKNGGEVNWENRPANSAKPGKTNTTTGEVKEANAGGYKKGGAAKKHFATGGSVNNAGHAVAMPRKPVSKPVANTMQSGTFAKGGKVEKEEKPNLRLLKTHTGPKGHVAKVYKDKDWGEHRVKFFNPEGKHEAGSDYHTDDVNDAHDTAQVQLNRYKSGGKVVYKAEGGMPTAESGYDPIVEREARRREAEKDATRRENEATPVMDSVKRLLGIRPNAGAGRGFVNPTMTRKAGGRAC
jgi:hypothetical protein